MEFNKSEIVDLLLDAKNNKEIHVNYQKTNNKMAKFTVIKGFNYWSVKCRIK
jgi:hypothetical protein